MFQHPLCKRARFGLNILACFLAGLLLLTACGGAPASATDSAAGPVIAGDTITFLYFYRDNCAPCTTMEPVITSLETDYQDRLAIQRYDADSEDGRQLMERYEVRDTPSYVMVGTDGARLWGLTGPIHRDMLRQQVQLRVGR
jgi:thiol-disulfide isomerase/thioredoxin